MQRLVWLVAGTLPLLAVASAGAEVLKGVLAIRGAEME
jgi:hypothetical protein